MLNILLLLSCLALSVVVGDSSQHDIDATFSSAPDVLESVKADQGGAVLDDHHHDAHEGSGEDLSKSYLSIKKMVAKMFKGISIPNASCPEEGGSAPEQSRTLPRFYICTHHGADVISGYFRRDGYWRDCKDLPMLAWNAFHISRGRREAKGGTDGAPVVLDIGGNIGSCALLLASQGCTVASFEPLHDNLMLFNASILVNGFQDRIHLFPVGASNVSKKAEIHTEQGNYGNSVVLKAENKKLFSEMKLSKDNHNVSLVLAKEPAKEIRLLPIDDVIRSHVHLMKLDCQGAELKALEGATTLLVKYGVDVIRLEFDPNLIEAVGSQPQHILDFLWRYGYTLYDEETVHILANKTCSAPKTDSIIEEVPTLSAGNASAYVKLARGAAREIIAFHSKMLEKIKANGAKDSPMELLKFFLPVRTHTVVSDTAMIDDSTHRDVAIVRQQLAMDQKRSNLLFQGLLNISSDRYNKSYFKWVQQNM